MQVFDISDLDQTASGLMREVVDAAHIARSAHSVSVDFMESGRYLDLWQGVVEVGYRTNPTMWDAEQATADTASALLKAAALAYWRAVDGHKDSPRVAMPLDQLLRDKVFAEAHNRLKAFRHNAVAHYGIDDPSEWQWQVDRIVFVLRDDGYGGLVYPWQRKQSSVQSATDLVTVLEKASPAFYAWFDKCGKKLLTKLRRLQDKDELSQVMGTPFDPEAFFVMKSSRQVERFWESTLRTLEQNKGVWIRKPPRPRP